MENTSDQHAGRTVLRIESSSEVKTLNGRGAYEHSLIGEYARLLLLLVVVPLLLCLSQLGTHHHALTALSAALVLLASLATTRGNLWFRAFLLTAMTFNVFSAVVNPNDVWSGNDKHNPLAILNLILLACLAVASIFEIGSLRRESSQSTWIKFLCWGALAIPTVGYIIGAPLVIAMWESISSDVSHVAQAPDWTMLNEILLRAAKFLVFAIFTYFGACIGSFLNVVAYCIPRGESVGMRDSCCPKCKTKIRRVDNLPILSYINLSARCRACKVPIPARYLIVELLVGAIFGSLFLYQLVTGAANVPTMGSLSHAGILWIVLYPKWHIIGIYFFHSLFMSFLVVLSLIEWDGQKFELRFSIGLALLFLISATLFLPLQPIPAPDFLSSLTGSIPAVSQIAKLVFGGAVGVAVASCLGAFIEQESRSTFIPAMALAGIVLGWQSVLHVSILFALIFLIVKLVARPRNPLMAQPSFILLIAVMIHHPIWKIVFQQFAI
ncbi:MAG: A24 family peptidase [Mariniblastus sp.]